MAFGWGEVNSQGTDILVPRQKTEHTECLCINIFLLLFSPLLVLFPNDNAAKQKGKNKTHNYWLFQVIVCAMFTNIMEIICLDMWFSFLSQILALVNDPNICSTIYLCVCCQSINWGLQLCFSAFTILTFIVFNPWALFSTCSPFSVSNDRYLGSGFAQLLSTSYI